MSAYYEGHDKYAEFRLAVVRGRLFAEPTVSRLTGKAVMKIMGWNSEFEILDLIDTKALPGEYSSVHEIPTKVLSCVFFSDSEHTGIQFSYGGTYSLDGSWEYPFSGDRIGAWVKRYDANAIANGELANNRGSNNEHAGAANA